MKKTKIRQTAISAIFVAIIAASAWISIPTPFGVSFTLQLFAVCLAGFLLGVKGALAATVVYIALGSVGLPIFSQFSGGIGVLFGATGGFLWGFLFTAFLCGIKTKGIIKCILMVLSILSCHTIGVIQYCFVLGVNGYSGFITASLPFLLKDFMLLILAYFISKKIKKKIKI